ncbi:hypothetical protein PhCBS80983_g00305 [Powellomyces hirtus]|uniref:PX domain-containing protein n=1 Tax=Powellomyces hirtus TaxID=109895 RepID=A0A507EFW5_9FUNG|nr:hypothetical protein PhCBS80983_g00305 [Powellomyces hirtus]
MVGSACEKSFSSTSDTVDQAPEYTLASSVYYSAITPVLSRTWSDSSSADTPPGSANPTPRNRGTVEIASVGSSLFRRSSSNSELTTEEAILTNVFSGELSPTIAETLFENDEMEVVPVYDAIAIFDHEPDSDDENGVSFKSGDRIRVFGKQDIRNTVLGTGDWGDDWAWEKEVEVSEGWCEVEVRGKVGFAPVSYMRFASDNTPMETRSQIELVLTDARPTLSSFAPLHIPPNHHMVDSYVSNAETSVSMAESTTSQLNYPSAISALGNGVGAITGRVRKSLKKLLGNWFEGDSVQDFIVGNLKAGISQDPTVAEEDEDESLGRFGASTETPPSGKHCIQKGLSWAGTAPPFLITLQSAERRRKVSLDDSYTRPNTVTDEFIAYKIVTWFPEDDNPSYTALSVYRRYTDFDWLDNHLQARFPPPVIPLPQLPQKYTLTARKFDKDHVESRRRALERYLNTLARHPILKAEESLILFLSCGGTSETGLLQVDKEPIPPGQEYQDSQFGIVIDDDEWINGKKQYDDEAVGQTQAGPASFFKRVHLMADVKLERGYPNMMDRFATHLSLMESHLDPLINSAQKHQQGTSGLQASYKDIAACLEVLARGRTEEGRLLRNVGWCWKRGCFECHEFSNALLAVSKHLNGVAETYDYHAKQDLTVFAERIREYHVMVSAFQPLSQLNDLAESRSDELDAPVIKEGRPAARSPNVDAQADGMKKRLNIILAVAQAEVERLHAEKTKGWEVLLREWVDGQISAQEKVLNHLYAARDALGANEA